MFVLDGVFPGETLDVGKLAEGLAADGWRVAFSSAHRLTAKKGACWPAEPFRLRASTPRRLVVESGDDGDASIFFTIGAMRTPRALLVQELVPLIELMPMLERVKRNPTPSSELRRWRRQARGILYCAVCTAAVALALFLKVFIAEPLIVPTPHLVPTVQAGERVLSYMGPGSERLIGEGRVVVCEAPNSPGQALSEWVLAEGPTVIRISNGVITRDGEPWESLMDDVSHSEDGTIAVPARSVLLGNRMSQNLLVLPTEEVRGVALAVYFPFGEARSLLSLMDSEGRD